MNTITSYRRSMKWRYDPGMRSVHDAVVIGAGQSGLVAAGELRRAGLEPVVLEAGTRPSGSWPRYYDSLRLFSPARYSALPGLPFPGDPDRYPHRDEVAAYLERYAAGLDADIRLGTTVAAVTGTEDGFAVHTADGRTLDAAVVVAATGSFGQPHRPKLTGLDRFAGRVLHACDYRNPESFDGQRVVIVGAGNSAVQIAAELAERAQVSLASRRPVRFVPQRPFGRDVHFWFALTRFDSAGWPRRLVGPGGMPVLDDGRYRSAVAAGRPDRRPLWTAIDGREITWADGTAEQVDTVLLATGYRPHFSYLDKLGALDADANPLHRSGVSTTHRGLGYVGLENQRSLGSATLRGVVPDARYVVERLAKAVRR
jgi:putative flavoprotein involved in K+ transport